MGRHSRPKGAASGDPGIPNGDSGTRTAEPGIPAAYRGDFAAEYEHPDDLGAAFRGDSSVRPTEHGPSADRFAAPAGHPGAADAAPVAPGAGRRRRIDGPATGPIPRVRPVPGGPAPEHVGGSTPAHGVPRVRGGHPEHHEGGGGWGEPSAVRHDDWYDTARPMAPTGTGPAGPVGRTGPAVGPVVRIPGPRREYVDAFDGRERTDTFEGQGRTDVFEGRDPSDTGARRTAAQPTVPAPRPVPVEDPHEHPDAPADPKPVKGKGRTLTGIAAAAVTTVLAVVVAGQVTSDGGHHIGAQSAGDSSRDDEGTASRSHNRATPEQAAPAQEASYEQKMALQYPIDPKLKGSGDFEAVPGFVAAPGKGRKYRYRVDVEKGLGLDGQLFADAVQRTLNDDRSWAHDGAMTFERISSGQPDFVVTLASPGTTATWCGKSGLDTTEDNVSCDSAATERVMINAFRWAQGSQTFGDRAMYAYRQMLINHEVGHRLGHGHVSCRTPGALAPVMQQQTKSLDIDGIKCRPNPWVFPTG
ncbi:DUF3152 domain-containing protein [Streptomyces sp. NPDC048696]|uniref:DUF3152 domain-containing protein n=1 Tax=Streptomyces sp. NPDC048696 TaxID=3365585 RepID=UPI003712CCC1